MLKITAEHLPSLGRQEYGTGHGKLSAYLYLREEKDKEILRGLVREADVFSQGYRPGTLAGRGFSPEALAEMRPGIVAVSLSGGRLEGRAEGFHACGDRTLVDHHRHAGRLSPAGVAGAGMSWQTFTLRLLLRDSIRSVFPVFSTPGF